MESSTTSGKSLSAGSNSRCQENERLCGKIAELDEEKSRLEAIVGRKEVELEKVNEELSAKEKVLKTLLETVSRMKEEAKDLKHNNSELQLNLKVSEISIADLNARLKLAEEEMRSKQKEHQKITSSTEKMRVEHERQIQELKEKIFSQQQAHANFMNEVFEEDLKHQRDREQSHKSFCEFLNSNFCFKSFETVGRPRGEEPQQETEMDKEPVLEAVTQLDSTRQEDSSGSSKADAVIKSDGPESFPASLPESHLPGKSKTAQVKMDLSSTGNHEKEQATDKGLRCVVCRKLCKSISTLRHHQTYSKCKSAFKKGGAFHQGQKHLASFSATAVDSKSKTLIDQVTLPEAHSPPTGSKNQQDTENEQKSNTKYQEGEKGITIHQDQKQLASSSTTAVDNQSEQQIKAETPEPHSSPTTSRKEEETENEQRLNKKSGKDANTIGLVPGHICLCGKRCPCARDPTLTGSIAQQILLNLFPCSNCNMRFHNTMALREHELKVHNNELSILDLNEPKRNDQQ